MRKYLNINSILFRLLISFLLIIMPMIIIGTAMFSWEKQAIQSEIENNASSNVSFLMNTLETEVENIKLLQYNLSSDRTLHTLVNDYKNLHGYEYYPMINDMLYRLQVMKDSDSFIQDIILFVPGMGHSISLMNEYQELQTDDVKSLSDKCTGKQFPIIIDDSGVYAVIAYPNIRYNEKTPQYLIQVKLSMDKIEGLLSKSGKYDKYGTALYDYSSKIWIFGSQNNPSENKFFKLEAITKLKGRNLNFSSVINSREYFVISGYSKYLNFSLVQYVPIHDIFMLPDRYGQFLRVYAIICILVVILYSFITYQLVHRPIKKIIGSFRNIKQGHLDEQISFRSADEFNYMYDEFNDMVNRINLLIENDYKQKIFTQKVELKQLQAQINPHFLYNSYFMLHRMILDRDFENMEALSRYLGTYFQFITRNASDDVTLSKELEHAASYARIQQMRFSEKMTLEIGEIPKAYEKLLVPRMIMQPILENSIEHGLDRSSEGGTVRISFEDSDVGLHIVIEDSGASISDSKIIELNQKLQMADDSMETTGVINVHRRLELKFGKGSGMQISRSILGGLKTKIIIITGNNSL